MATALRASAVSDGVGRVAPIEGRPGWVCGHGTWVTFVRVCSVDSPVARRRVELSGGMIPLSSAVAKCTRGGAVGHGRKACHGPIGGLDGLGKADRKSVKSVKSVASVAIS
jgi:hypothetical protein